MHQSIFEEKGMVLLCIYNNNSAISAINFQLYANCSMASFVSGVPRGILGNLY